MHIDGLICFLRFVRWVIGWWVVVVVNIEHEVLCCCLCHRVCVCVRHRTLVWIVWMVCIEVLFCFGLCV